MKIRKYRRDGYVAVFGPCNGIRAMGISRSDPAEARLYARKMYAHMHKRGLR